MKKPLDFRGYGKFLEELQKRPLAAGSTVGSLHKKLRSLEDRQRATSVCALALAVHGASRCFKPEVVSSLGFPRPVPLDVDSVRYIAGGGKAVRRKLEEGLGEEYTSRLGKWVPGFIRGLKISGGLISGGGSVCWRVLSPQWREGLVRSFREEGLPSFMVGEEHKCGGSFYVPVGGLWVSRMGGGEGSLEELAGVVGGGKGVEHNGHGWLLVNYKSKGILDAHGVCYQEYSAYGEHGRKLLLSPFWGAILSGVMPGSLGSWMGGFRKPGDCPLLPWVVWSACVGRGCRRPPLPYIVNRDCLKGMSLKEVREEGVRSLGLGGMSDVLRGEVVRWVRERGFEC